jgi:hypothetical protein
MPSTRAASLVGLQEVGDLAVERDIERVLIDGVS